jgi:hypothetical protein
LVAGLAVLAVQSGAHRIVTLGLGMSRARLTWLVVLACGVALAVGQAAPAAVGDAEARRIVQTQASAVNAQFGWAESCFTARSVPCLRSATYSLYSFVLGAKAKVVALRTRPLSPRVRSGVGRYIRALDRQVWASYELYQAALSLYVPRINQALTNMRYALADADRAIALIYS